jgi:hypothetical protein
MHYSNNMPMLKAIHSVMTNLKSTTSQTIALSNHLLRHDCLLSYPSHFIFHPPLGTQHYIKYAAEKVLLGEPRNIYITVKLFYLL